MTQIETKRSLLTDKEDNLETEISLVQLQELNARSRWYTSQLWHIPFAYLAATAVPLSQLEEGRALLPGFLFSALLGHLVLQFWNGVCSDCERSVRDLRQVEEHLGIKRAQFTELDVQALRWILIAGIFFITLPPWPYWFYFNSTTRGKSSRSK